MSYLKVSMLGAISGGEVWSTTVCYRFFALFPTTLTQQVLDSAANRLVTAITSETLPSNFRALLSASGSITGWRVTQHDENETTIGVGQANYPGPIVGANPPTKTPQDALVISLRTGQPGARGRGRVYFPAMGASTGPTFKLNAPSNSQVVSDAAVLFDLIGDQLNAELAANSMAATVELAVRSVTAHVCYQVNQLRVGDVLDTQRRRRDRLVENVATSGYPLP